MDLAVKTLQFEIECTEAVGLMGNAEVIKARK